MFLVQPMPMRSEQKFRPTAVIQMKRLAALGLGEYEPPRDGLSRDKFQLSADYIGVLASRETDGFIRADASSLLFRAITGSVMSSFPDDLVRRAKVRPEKGLWLNWGAFTDTAEVVALFDTVAEVAAAASGEAAVHVVETPDSWEESIEPTGDLSVLDRRVASLMRRGLGDTPEGCAIPRRSARTVEIIEREPRVKAWVLLQAAGQCELCREPAPFTNRDGFPYLDVHHVVPLGEGGPDTVDNAVAVCPNCHRRLHWSIDATAALQQLRSLTPRIRN